MVAQISDVPGARERATRGRRPSKRSRQIISVNTDWRITLTLTSDVLRIKIISAFVLGFMVKIRLQSSIIH